MPEEWRSLEPAVRNGLSECRVRRGCEVESMVCVPGSGRGESVGRNFRPSFDRPSFAPERVGRSVNRSVGRSKSLDTILYMYNAPEGCPHGTHTSRTAYTRGTHSREHTQTHTNKNKHTVQKGSILNMTIRAPDPFLRRKEARSFGVFRPQKTIFSLAARRAAGRSVGTGRVGNAQNRPRGSVPSVGLGRRDHTFNFAPPY